MPPPSGSHFITQKPRQPLLAGLVDYYFYIHSPVDLAAEKDINRIFLAAQVLELNLGLTNLKLIFVNVKRAVGDSVEGLKRK